MNTLNIFISSTCNDLASERKILGDNLKVLGHNVIQSENDTFPVNPKMDTIENCLKVIKDLADIMVLIISTKAGTITENGKSITHLEFITARAKGIPVYTFVNPEVLAKFYEFKLDPENFEIGEYPKELFNLIKDTEPNWRFDHIDVLRMYETLKTQFSISFKEALTIKNRFDGKIPEIYKLNISSQALKILIDNNENTTLKYFSQVLNDEIESIDNEIKDYENSVIVETKNVLFNLVDSMTWLISRYRSYILISKSLENLINKFFKKAFADDNIKDLLYFSRTYALTLKNMISWYFDTKNAHLNDECSKLQELVASTMGPNIEVIKNFPITLSKQIIEVENDIKLGKEIKMIKSNITLIYDEKLKQSIENETAYIARRIEEGF